MALNGTLRTAALAAIVLLAEHFTLKLLAPMVAILGGIALVIRCRQTET